MSHHNLHTFRSHSDGGTAPGLGPQAGAQPQSFLEFTEEEENFFSTGQARADAAEPSYIGDRPSPQALRLHCLATALKATAAKAADLARSVVPYRSVRLPNRRSLALALGMGGLVLAAAG